METQFKPGDGVPTTLVEITVSCRNLRNTDIVGKSDPYCIMYTKWSDSEQWKMIGQTETISNNLNPDFLHKFVLDYFFEELQQLKFEVMDYDSFKKNDTIGSVECTMSDIVSSMKNIVSVERPLKKGDRQDRNYGTIILFAEELSACKNEVTLQFCATKLDKKDVFGKSDPFLVLSRATENGFTIVHKTEVIKTNLNPTWRPFTIPIRVLCNGQDTRVVRIECYDWNQSGSHALIGTCETTLLELEKGPGRHNEYPLINPAKKKKEKKYTDSGVVKLLSYQLKEMNTFMEYIIGGTEMQCIIAVDFTTSNGDPRSPHSLHRVDPSVPNMYEQALRSVGEIIQDYDSDKWFPAFGFGAKLPHHGPGEVSHKFPLNDHPTKPECFGVDGVMKAYQKRLDTVQLSGPTNFAPIINHVASLALSSGAPGVNYFILLILTDGVGNDMNHTKEAIVNASALPLSIIIVGIGDADFEEMKELDGDDDRVSSKGRYAERDIVQFVQFSKFIGGSFGNDYRRSQMMLAKEVLAEIPDQMMSYMNKYGVKPKSPSPRPR